MGKRAGGGAAGAAGARAGREAHHHREAKVGTLHDEHTASKGLDGEEDETEKVLIKDFPPWWVPQPGDATSTKKLKKFITIGEVVKLHGVPHEHLTTYLQKELKEANSCKSLPFTLLLVIAYSSVVIMNDNAPAVNAVEDSIADDIVNNANFAFNGHMGFKGIFDVNSALDFWSWMSMGLVPLVFVQQRAWSEDYFQGNVYQTVKNQSDFNALNIPWTINNTFRGMYINHNRIVGGLRLSQERSESQVTCVNPQTLIDVYNMPCVGGFRYELDPEMWDARSTADEERKREQWFYFTQSVKSVQDQLWNMEKTNWLDKYTQKVEVVLPVYNAEYGIHAIIHCNFFFSRGGHIWKAVIPLSVFSDFLDGWFKIAADVTFIGCLLWMLFAELVEIVVDLRSKGIFGVCIKFTHLEKWGDWFSVLAGATIITMLGFLLKMVGHVNDAGTVLASFVKKEDYTQYTANIELYVTELETAVHYYHKVRIVMAAYPGVIVFRLFRTFAAQARLAIVTNSLSKASTDLFHFMIIFMAIFMIFAISALSLFGHNVDDYATISISRTLTTNFLTMQGAFDWDMIKGTGRLEAGAWFWVFTILLAFVLLNMLIAIVMDAYTEVKDEAKDSATMWEEVKTIAKRTVGEHEILRVTIGRCLKKLGVVDIHPLVPLGSLELAIAAKCHHLARMLARDQIAFGEWEEERRHLRNNTIGDAPPPKNPADNPDDYELKPLKVRSLCELVRDLKPGQAKDLLISATQHYHETHATAASYEDIVFHLKNLVVSFKDLKHEVQRALGEPSSLIPECSYKIRDKVEHVWSDLRRKARETVQVDKTPVNEDPSLPVKDRVMYLEKELVSVREHVDQELSKVSGLQWEVSRIREERSVIENAIHKMQNHAAELANQKAALNTRLAILHKSKETREAALDQPHSDGLRNTELMEYLAVERGKLAVQLSARGQKVVEVPRAHQMSDRISVVKSARKVPSQKGQLARQALRAVPEEPAMEPRQSKEAKIRRGSSAAFEQAWLEHGMVV